ncbi:MAG TPA: phosphatidylglycerophosphatase A [Burkholderiales bacterium]|nr:phosphatidylglycerophosphatase A [Burkholderiales bacterium]
MRILAHPAHFIAFGFGAGLARFAPGTWGTLLGWGLGALLLPVLEAPALFALLAIAFLVGIWACGVTGRHLGAHDHGSMVWDEVVAFLLVLAIVPREVFWQLGAFVAFRFFDIVKPPPIRRLERRWQGGFGVMLDDLVAAGYTLLVLALFKRIFLG